MTEERPKGLFARRRARPNCFTLLEMIVAMAILSIIVIVLLGVNTSMMNTWEFAQARNERRTSGQAALDRIARDLRQAAMPMYRSSTNLEFVINPTSVSSTYEFPQAVFWQAPIATDGGTNGNLAVVGYFVQWINGVPSLCRALINPSSSSYLIYSGSPSSWISDSLIQTNAPATAATGYAGLLANNVLGLWVQALDPSGNPIRQSGGGVTGESFDSRLSYSYTNSVYTTVATTNMPSAVPAAVQIAILVLDGRTARRLTGSEKPAPSSLTGNFWSDINTFKSSLPLVIQKGSEVQTITVDLANGPR